MCAVMVGFVSECIMAMIKWIENGIILPHFAKNSCT